MKTTHTVVTDDIDGADGAETILFAYRGVEYSIDLADKNTAKFEKALSPYLAAASRIGGRKTTTTSSGRKSNGNGGGTGGGNSARTGARRDLGAVRAWARENGYDVSDRGRVSVDILAAYDAS